MAHFRYYEVKNEKEKFPETESLQEMETISNLTFV